MKKQYFVARMERVVYVDPMFVKKAGQLDTDESELYDRLLEKYPDFKFEVKSLNVSKKNVYSELTYEVMEAFINFHEDEEGRAAVITEYRAVRAAAVFKKAPYSYVKSWFLKNYKDEYNKSSFAEERKGKNAEAIHTLNNPAVSGQ